MARLGRVMLAAMELGQAALTLAVVVVLVLLGEMESMVLAAKVVMAVQVRHHQSQGHL